jgi:hypothetical protein
MKFNILINKQANFYFFIQNLSEWHFSNRKDYNIFWHGKFSKFSAQEERALKQFKEIRQRYKPGRTHFEIAFFSAKNPWRVLKNNLSAEEYAVIKEIFELLQDKFEIIYKKDLPLLVRWKEVLNNKINSQLFLGSVINLLSLLFNTPPSEKEITIYLLLSAPGHTGGGANIDEKSVSIEISRYLLNKINQEIGIIWHETIHLAFQNQYFFPLLLEQFLNSRQSAELVNEVVIGSLFPKGILGVRLLNNKPASKLIPNVSSEQTIKILNLTKEYVDKKNLLTKSILKKYRNLWK